MESQDNQKVSVIIPVYNSERFIGETIESALAQTYEHLEIVVVDDGSTDRSRTIIEGYRENHANVSYYLLERNSGAAQARNIGLSHATGRYAAFLDSDDLWHPSKLEKQIALMRSKQALICFTAIELIDEQNDRIKGKRTVREKVDYRCLLRNTMIATSSVVIDRSKLGSFSLPTGRKSEDYAAWLKLMRDGAIAHGINEPLVRYRMRKNSLSSNKFKEIRNVWSIQREVEGIPALPACVNVICVTWNAIKKYYV